jgi:hypothetical protein
VGALLTAAGSKEKQATDQLRASVDATGGSYEDYAGKIEKVVRREENFAHSAVDTKTALQVLTQATGDEQKALDSMQLVTDLAAAKHISLADAAAQVAKILAGKGGKTLAQYGIVMKTNADGTKDVADAVTQLGDKLKGQGAASMDNFGAKVDIVKTKLTDFVGEVGQKVGPALTVAGTVIGVVSGGLDILAARSARAATAQTAMGVSATGAATAEGELATASVTASGASLGLLGVLGKFGPAAVVATAGIYGAAQAAQDKLGPLAGRGAQVAAGWLDLIAKQTHTTVDAITAAVSGTDEQFAAYIGSLSGLSDLTRGILTDMHKKLGAASTSTHTLTDASDRLGTSQLITTTKIDGATVSIGKQVTAAKTLSTAFDRLNGAALSVEQTEDAFRDSLSTVSASVKDNGRSLDQNTTKGRANREMLVGLIGQANDAAQAKADLTAKDHTLTAAVQAGTTSLKNHEAKIRDAAIAAGLDKKEVDKLIASLGRIPKVVTSKVRVDVTQTTRTIGGTAYGGHLTQGHASGGMLTEGWNIVNEPNDEWLYKQGSQVQVYPHGTGGPVSNGSSGGPSTVNHIYNINLPGLYGGQDAGRQVASILEKHIGAGGTLKIQRGIRG